MHYPGLPDHPEHELARRQMPAGAGGVLAFELADGETAGHCEEAVRLIRNATSLGGVETLIERRAHATLLGYKERAWDNHQDALIVQKLP